VLRGENGSIRAGASCHRLRGGRLWATANVYTEDWDIVAADQEAQAELWRRLAQLAADHLYLPALRSPQSVALPAGPSSTLDTALSSRLSRRVHTLSFPHLGSSCSPLSRKLLKRLRYCRRLAEREGTVRFRTTSGGEQLERDLDAFLHLEGAGWKRRRERPFSATPDGTALPRVRAPSGAEGLASAAPTQLDGRPIAGDLACSFAGGSFLLKTGFDERYARLSPGLLLRAEALRAAIVEGSSSYDFLGEPDDRKLSWTSDARRAPLSMRTGDPGGP
jgi:CelD/BcsL family acetyltransferase involved in cellulose biosynthesis